MGRTAEDRMLNLVRILYCLVPALIVLMVFWQEDRGAAVLAFMVLFGFSWNMTRAIPERGER